MKAEHSAGDLLREWFNRGLSGCKFASLLASETPRYAFNVQVGPAASLCIDDLEMQIDAAAAKSEVHLLVLPRVKSEAEIVELARGFDQAERWHVSAHSCPNEPDLLGLSIEFFTQSGARSATMGFAPSGSMPVTRRAPYVALATWGGGRENPHFERGGSDVNFADVPTRLPKESYESMWASSQKATRVRLEEPRFDSKWLRKISFCLPRPLAEPWLAPPL